MIMGGVKDTVNDVAATCVEVYKFESFTASDIIERQDLLGLSMPRLNCVAASDYDGSMSVVAGGTELDGTTACQTSDTIVNNE